MGKITFVPVGGLANRMRAVASAVMLAGKTKTLIPQHYYKIFFLST